MVAAARVVLPHTEPPATEELRLPDGAVARVVGAGLELRDARGALLIRYADGHAEVHAPRDITLAADGDIRLRAGKQVAIEAADGVAVASPKATLHLERGEVIARVLSVSAGIATGAYERYQLRTEQLVEHARDAFRDVRGLLQTRVERMRTLVAGEHSVHAERTVMVSREETTIDGKRILLG